MKKTMKKYNKSNLFFINYFKYIVIFISKFSIIIDLYCTVNSFKYIFYSSKYSKISLKVKGIGESYILGKKFLGIEYLNEVLINGIRQGTKSIKYLFNRTNNFVELIWDNGITICVNMFNGCTNITEIDLSNFDASNVNNMGVMFANCSSLTLINFSNFDTSQSTNIGTMFSSCTSLTSLDLSSFNTSKITCIDNLFYNCFLLTSIDLSNFDTSQVTYMFKMFYNCT